MTPNQQAYTKEKIKSEWPRMPVVLQYILMYGMSGLARMGAYNYSKGKSKEYFYVGLTTSALLIASIALGTTSVIIFFVS